MRDWHQVPCVNATFAQVQAGVHVTMQDDRVCDKCRAVLAVRADLTRRSLAVGAGTDSAQGSVPASSSLPDRSVADRSVPTAPLSASRYATEPCAPACEPLSTSQVER